MGAINNISYECTTGAKIAGSLALVFAITALVTAILGNTDIAYIAVGATFASILGGILASRTRVVSPPQNSATHVSTPIDNSPLLYTGIGLIENLTIEQLSSLNRNFANNSQLITDPQLTQIWNLREHLSPKDQLELADRAQRSLIGFQVENLFQQGVRPEEVLDPVLSDALWRTWRTRRPFGHRPN